MGRHPLSAPRQRPGVLSLSSKGRQRKCERRARGQAGKGGGKEEEEEQGRFGVSALVPEAGGSGGGSSAEKPVREGLPSASGQAASLLPGQHDLCLKVNDPDWLLLPRPPPETNVEKGRGLARDHVIQRMVVKGKGRKCASC